LSAPARLLASSPHNDHPAIARRLYHPHTSIDGIDEHARHLVFFVAVGGRHNELRADLELHLLHGTSEPSKVPNSARGAVTGLTPSRRSSCAELDRLAHFRRRRFQRVSRRFC